MPRSAMPVPTTYELEIALKMHNGIGSRLGTLYGCRIVDFPNEAQRRPGRIG